MDKKLKTLFNYQEFEKDGELISMKEEAECRYGSLLTDDELGLSFGGNNVGFLPIIFDTVNFHVGEEIKQGKIIDVKKNQYLIDNYGWINKNDICQ